MTMEAFKKPAKVNDYNVMKLFGEVAQKMQDEWKVDVDTICTVMLFVIIKIGRMETDKAQTVAWLRWWADEVENDFPNSKDKLSEVVH